MMSSSVIDLKHYLLACDSLFGSLCDVSGVETVGSEQLSRCAGLAELVPTVYILHRSRNLHNQDAGDEFAKTARHVVLLSYNYCASFESRRYYRSLVERFNSGYVNDFCAYSFCLECFSSLKRFPNHVACSDDGNVLPSFIT